MLNPVAIVEQVLEVIWTFIEPNPLPGLKIVPTGKAIRNLLTKRGKGFNLTGKLRLSHHDSYRGAMIVGGTGTGKSRKILIPSLLSMQGSFVVHDPSGELLNATAHGLSRRGYDIEVFKPTAPQHSIKFNYLHGVTSDAECRVAARRIIKTSYPDPQGDGFWELSATSFLSLNLSLLLRLGADRLSLPNLYHIVHQWMANPKAIEKLFKKFKDEAIWSEYMSVSNYDEKLLSSIIATAKGALSYMVDEGIQAASSEQPNSNRSAGTTSQNETRRLGAKMLRSQPTAVFIQTETTKANDYQALISLLFDRLFEELMSTLPKAGEQDVFLLLDEAGSLQIPTLPVAMANVRKYNVGILLALQDFNQLVSQYGKDKASAIRSNSWTQLLFGGAGLETSEYYSKLFGFADRTQEGYTRRLPVLAVNEIREIAPDQALLVCGNLKPYIMNYKKLKQMPNEPIQLNYTHQEVPLLDLEKRDL